MLGRMATYLVEAYATKLDDLRIRGLAAGARAAARAMTRNGAPVSYLGSIFVPEDETCFHLLEAPSPEVIRQARGHGSFAFERIVEAIELRGVNQASPKERKEPDMAQYMVERHLPGFPPEQLPAAASAAKQKSAEITAEGTQVRYLRSTWTPDDEKLYCLFEGSSQEAIAEVQKRASLPYERIHAAGFLTAEEVD